MVKDSPLDAALAPMAALRTLVVEDDDDSRELMATLLGAEGAHVLALSSTGEEGLARLRRDAFDLIVTDIGLPGILGLEMLDQAKAEGLIGGASLIVCSATEGVEAEVARRGATFLCKPVDSQTFVAIVHRCRSERHPCPDGATRRSRRTVRSFRGSRHARRSFLEESNPCKI
jgi:CheY-like chemotaxis protein